MDYYSDNFDLRDFLAELKSLGQKIKENDRELRSLAMIKPEKLDHLKLLMDTYSKELELYQDDIFSAIMAGHRYISKLENDSDLLKLIYPSMNSTQVKARQRKREELIRKYFGNQFEESKPRNDIPKPRIMNSANNKDYSTAIDPISVRPLAVSIVAPFADHNDWNTKQAAALYDYVRNNINGVKDPVGQEYIASPAETINTCGGDCEDKAILLASLCLAVGIQARLVICKSSSNQGHCLTEIGYNTNQDMNVPSNYLGDYYKDRFVNMKWSWENQSNGIWLVADPSLCMYLGDIDNLVKFGYATNTSNGWKWNNPVRYYYQSK